MIAYIDGRIAGLTPTYAIMEIGGLGYHVHISLNTYSQLTGHEKYKLLTYLQIKEDAHLLFGFGTEEERSLFVHLISVNGVGAGIARLILSAMTPFEVSSAIINEDERALGRVKGIGPKTAKRILIDLKDKLRKDVGEMVLQTGSSSMSVRDEAISALIALGFQKQAVEKTINEIFKTGETTNLEQLVKAGLRSLAG